MSAAPDLPLLLAAASILMAATLLVLALAGAGGLRRSRRLRRRIARLQHTTAAGQQQAGRDVRPALRREQEVRLFGGLSARLVRLAPRPEQLRRHLRQAGIRLGLGDFVLLLLAAGAACGFGAYLLGLPLAGAGLAALAGGLWLPALYLRMRKRRRAAAFLRLLPEAVDLMVRAVRSGLPVTEAIALIGEEVADPVGEIFREVTNNVRIGLPLEEALWTGLERIDVPEFRFLVVSLAIQRETGGNLAEILHNLGSMIRKREQTKLKIRAMSSEARASAMIIGSLPFIMAGVLLTINPDYVLKLVTDPRGLMATAYGLGSMATGALVIARMIRFEI